MGPWEPRILECIPDVGPWEPWILKGILDVGPWKPRILKCILDMEPWEPRILKCILDAWPWEPRILNCILDAGPWGSWTLIFCQGTCLPPMSASDRGWPRVTNFTVMSPSAYKISTQSVQPLPRNSRRNICCIPPGSTRHVPQWILARFSISLIHGRRDGGTHQRRPLVNRAFGARDISLSKAWPWPAGRPVAHTQNFPLFSVELAWPSASLVTTLHVLFWNAVQRYFR